MRVSIQHNQKSTGFIFTKPYIEVVTSVTFSEEEKAIIRSKKLQKFVVLDREHDFIVRKRFENDPKYLASIRRADLTIAELVTGPDAYRCETPMHAKQYEAEVTAALKTLKDFITGNTEVAQSKSFEL